MLGQVSIVLGWALVLQGHSATGLAQLRQGLETLQNIGAKLPWPLVQLVDAYRHMRQPEEGLRVLDTLPGGLRVATADSQPQGQEEKQLSTEIPSLLWLKGELLLQLPRPELQQAEQYFLQARELARRQRARSDELRIVMSLCRLWQPHKSTAAHQMLTDVYRAFTEGHDTPDLMEAQALRQALG